MSKREVVTEQSVTKKQKITIKKADLSSALDWIAAYWDRYLFLSLRNVSQFFWTRFVNTFPFPFGIPKAVDLQFLRHPKALTHLFKRDELTRRLDYLASCGANSATVIVLHARTRSWKLQNFEPRNDQQLRRVLCIAELPQLPWDCMFRPASWDENVHQVGIGRLSSHISRAMLYDNAHLLYAYLSFYFCMKRNITSKHGLSISYTAGAAFPRECLLLINRLEVARMSDYAALTNKNVDAQAIHSSSGFPMFVSSAFNFPMNAPDLTFDPYQSNTDPLSYPWVSPFHGMELPWQLVRTHREFHLLIKTDAIIHAIWARPLHVRLFFAKKYLEIFKTDANLRKLRRTCDVRLSQLKRYLEDNLGSPDLAAVQQLAFVQVATRRPLNSLFARFLIMEHNEATFNGEVERYVNICRSFPEHPYHSNFVSFAIACLAAKLSSHFEAAVSAEILKLVSYRLLGIDLTSFSNWAHERSWTIPAFELK